MNHAAQLLIIAGVLFLSVLSPGPNFAIVTSTAMTVSRRAGMLAALGLAAASFSWALLAVAGLGLIVARLPWIHAAVQMAGAVYLIWIGGKMLIGARQPLPVADGRRASGIGAPARPFWSA